MNAKNNPSARGKSSSSAASDQKPEAFIGFPCYKTTNPVTAWCLVAMAKDFGAKIRLDMALGDAMIYHARNVLVQRFLESEAKWLLFLDDDMIIPIGRPAFLRQMGRLGKDYPERALALNTLTRLIQHNEPVVGATYFSRHAQGHAINGLATDREYFRRASAFHDGTMATPWIGTGCLLIAREVFLTMREKFPELEPRNSSMPWNYFHPMADGRGEDISFCARAVECGHQPRVDTMLHALHVGYGTYGVQTAGILNSF